MYHKYGFMGNGSDDPGVSQAKNAQACHEIAKTLGLDKNEFTVVYAGDNGAQVLVSVNTVRRLAVEGKIPAGLI